MAFFTWPSSLFQILPCTPVPVLAIRPASDPLTRHVNELNIGHKLVARITSPLVLVVVQYSPWYLAGIVRQGLSSISGRDAAGGWGFSVGLEGGGAIAGGSPVLGGAGRRV